MQGAKSVKEKTRMQHIVGMEELGPEREIHEIRRQEISKMR